MPLTSFRKARAKEELRLILPEINEILESEPAVLRINPESIMLIGDIHGDLYALEFINGMRKKTWLQKKFFFGRYVDRGTEGTEVLTKLFQMKLEEPEDVFLLRGNHETVDMNIYYGFFEEIGYDRDFLLEISRTYDVLPVAAVVSGHTFCVHGGINGTESVDSITKEGAFPYLWNDPSELPGLSRSSRGSTVREFGPDIVDGFFRNEWFEKNRKRAHSS